jgi:hypothetical protein
MSTHSICDCCERIASPSARRKTSRCAFGCAPARGSEVRSFGPASYGTAESRALIQNRWFADFKPALPGLALRGWRYPSSERGAQGSGFCASHPSLLHPSERKPRSPGTPVREGWGTVHSNHKCNKLYPQIERDRRSREVGKWETFFVFHFFHLILRRIFCPILMMRCCTWTLNPPTLLCGRSVKNQSVGHRPTSDRSRAGGRRAGFMPFRKVRPWGTCRGSGRSGFPSFRLALRRCRRYGPIPYSLESPRLWTHPAPVFRDFRVRLT